MSEPKPEALLPLPNAVFHILIALADRNRHGYSIMQDVSARTGGKVRLSAGTLYSSIARMLEQEPVDGERGSVVTIASVEGLEGTAGGSSYNASKGAVVIFTKNLAIDYGRAGIRANAICPGFIETPLLEGVFGMPGMEDVRESIRREHKLRRLGRPEEIGAVALFLVSADASFVSGQAIAVDGGYTAGRDHGVTDMFGI